MGTMDERFEKTEREELLLCTAKGTRIAGLRKKYYLSDLEFSLLAGSPFGAGSDTSSSTSMTFVLACCAFPEVLPKAWEELDRVVGNN
jgi:cytochrome P450